jgi:hypothetical protein
LLVDALVVGSVVRFVAWLSVWHVHQHIVAVTNANDAMSNAVGGIADAAAAAVPGRGTTASRTGGENARTSPSSW